jgi:hypothetical protein
VCHQELLLLLLLLLPFLHCRATLRELLCAAHFNICYNHCWPGSAVSPVDLVQLNCY